MKLDHGDRRHTSQRLPLARKADGSPVPPVFRHPSLQLQNIDLKSVVWPSAPQGYRFVKGQLIPLNPSASTGASGGSTSNGNEDSQSPSSAWFDCPSATSNPGPNGSMSSMDFDVTTSPVPDNFRGTLRHDTLQSEQDFTSNSNIDDPTHGSVIESVSPTHGILLNPITTGSLADTPRVAITFATKPLRKYISDYSGLS